MYGKDSRRLTAYLWLVTAVAIPVIVVVGRQAVQTGVSGLGTRGITIVVTLSLILIAGELWPIPVARGEEAGDEITVSSTFGLALLLLAPVFYVVVAQAVALIVDGLVRRRRLNRLPFNVAQYALAFVAARVVYAALTGQPITPVTFQFPVPELAPALVASIVFLVVNNGLTGVAVAWKLNAHIARVLTQDLRWQVSTSAPLLALGTIVAETVSWTPWSLPVLLVPVAALYRSASLAMRREQEALRDALTGLANRTMLTTTTARAIESATAPSAVLLIDLDHFKEINDTLGHAVGDELLVAVAHRLLSSVRAYDLVARLGGDEFAVLARSIEGPEDAEALAERIGEGLRQTFRAGSVRIDVHCSIGIALAPDHSDSVEGLLRCADIALYSAKATRGTYALYDPECDTHSVARLGLQADLRRALEDPDDTQVTVYYQPQLDLNSGTVATVECLLRWNHPELGNLAPDVFIPLAESTTLIERVTRRVMEQTLVQLGRWEADGLVLGAAINLSARHLGDLSLPETVQELLTKYDIAPQRLILEVTESRLMTDPVRSAEILHRLGALGVELSIDDFGTGYSSLAYLQRLEVHELKVDKSFVARLADEPNDATIVRSTIELGHNLNLRMVAEGVEDLPTAQQLVALGCDRLQGYLLGRPAPASEVAGVIERMRPLHALLHEAATGRQPGRPGLPAVPLTLPSPREPEQLAGERKVSG
jgi:diguanylate cyclase (GGDEF)-like protein